MELEGNTKILKANESTYIPLDLNTDYQIQENPLILIEVQSGSILGRHIVRFEDNYGRKESEHISKFSILIAEIKTNF